MLIRWMAERDLDAWRALSAEYDEVISSVQPDMSEWYNGFEPYMKRKIAQYDAVAAIDRMSENCLGAIAFSRTNNAITFFAVSKSANFHRTADKLLTVALRQLDTGKEISVNVPKSGHALALAEKEFFEISGFVVAEDNALENGCPMWAMLRPPSSEKRGGSFHYRYPEFIRASQREHCPVCNGEPQPDLEVDIDANDTVWICGQYPGQGRLFGKLYVMPRTHAFHFEDMPPDEAGAFMREVQRVGRALRKVTGAEKINYEMHANSGAHLHIHLFPRYLDDDFPSAPIDYRLTEPAPYESYDEYLWFIERMRAELLAGCLGDGTLKKAVSESGLIMNELIDGATVEINNRCDSIIALLPEENET
jgi:diadenosine tetraphosphate (Ap4A) HIT family hydrolase